MKSVRVSACVSAYVRTPRFMKLLAHLGLGTFSSGNGVQVESGDFCSLKRPVKVLATSAMS